MTLGLLLQRLQSLEQHLPVEVVELWGKAKRTPMNGITISYEQRWKPAGAYNRTTRTQPLHKTAPTHNTRDE